MRPLAAAVVLTCALLGAACDEDGGIKVKNIDFKGTKGIDAGDLKRALATKEGSWLPWGPKKYFDRSRFDADLKRIQAFYADHGYPDARVQSADVQMNEKKDAVSITVHVSEGEPVIVEERCFEGGRAPGVVVRRLRRTALLQAGAPLDRQAFAATREAAPTHFATVDIRTPRSSRELRAAPEARRLAAVYRATPGAPATFGSVEIAGNASVGPEVIRRQLTFRPGDPHCISQLQDSAACITSSCSNLRTSKRCVGKGSRQVPTRVTVAEGKHRRLNVGVGYGTEEKFRGHAVAARELLRRRPHCRRGRALFVARPRSEGGSLGAGFS